MEPRDATEATAITNPRAEAYERLGGRYEVRVLEPSPPAVHEPPWFADDPAARGSVPPGRTLVSPVGTGEIRWKELAGGDPALSEWCAERWLGPYHRLGAIPANLVETRGALHRLAEHAISPARRTANGKIGLRYTRGGFGTPFFGDDIQIRVSGTQLVVIRSGREQRAPVSSLARAREQVGIDLLPETLEREREPLSIDPSAAEFLGDWYGFAVSVLEQLRAEAPETLEPSRVQLWPEHFDMSVELGSESGGRRAAYGLSPGDKPHPEPYVYVAPWVAPDPGDLWQAGSFAGAELGYEALVGAEDQRETALVFLRERLSALTAD